MADNRKYYYLKLKENFFDSDSIVLLEDMKDGILYSNILLKVFSFVALSRCQTSFLSSQMHENSMYDSDWIYWYSNQTHVKVFNSYGISPRLLSYFTIIELTYPELFHFSQKI